MPDWIIWILDKVILAVMVGLVTSAMFFCFLSWFKPKIEVSPVIARGTSTKNGKTIYRIKIINKTHYPITDIKAQLHIFKHYQTANGEIWKSDAVELKRADPISIDKFDKKDLDANYAYRFLTYENIESKWTDDNVQFVRFRIFARHATSGFGGFFEKDYRLKRLSLVEGEFSKGNTFDVV
jgi:hypothetical protein